MVIEAVFAAVLVALASLVGVFFYGSDKRLVGIERYVVPVAVGVFLSIVLNGLIPETLASSPEWGGLVIAFGFIVFYILANILHQKYHAMGAEDCDRKSAAMLLLIGDGFHNLVDGIVLGGAFLIDPTVGIATAVGLALHEVPQEIVEFGVLLRAGYTKLEAAVRNLISASSIILGVLLMFVFAQFVTEYVWVVTGIAAGNLLFLAASDLLPRIHGNLSHYHSIWHSVTAIIVGFAVMSVILHYTHAHPEVEHGHEGEAEIGLHIDEGMAGVH